MQSTAPPAVLCLVFSIGGLDVWNILFSTLVYVNLGVWQVKVEHAADGDFMAQAGESLREECWLPDKMKYILSWIKFLDYYITKNLMLGLTE